MKTGHPIDRRRRQTFRGLATICLAVIVAIGWQQWRYLGEKVLSNCTVAEDILKLFRAVDPPIAAMTNTICAEQQKLFERTWSGDNFNANCIAPGEVFGLTFRWRQATTIEASAIDWTETSGRNGWVEYILQPDHHGLAVRLSPAAFCCLVWQLEPHADTFPQLLASPEKQQAANTWMQRLDTGLQSYVAANPVSTAHQQWQQLALMMICHDTMSLDKSRQLDQYLLQRIRLNPLFASELFINGDTGQQAFDYNAQCLADLGRVWARWNSADWPIPLRSMTRPAWAGLHPPVPHVRLWLAGIMILGLLGLGFSLQTPAHNLDERIRAIAVQHHLSVESLRANMPMGAATRYCLVGFGLHRLSDRLSDIAKNLEVSRAEEQETNRRTCQERRDGISRQITSLGCNWPAWQDVWRHYQARLRQTTSIEGLDQLNLEVAEQKQRYHRSLRSWERVRAAWSAFPHNDPAHDQAQAIWEDAKLQTTIDPTAVERLEVMLTSATLRRDTGERGELETLILELLVTDEPTALESFATDIDHLDVLPLPRLRELRNHLMTNAAVCTQLAPPEPLTCVATIDPASDLHRRLATEQQARYTQPLIERHLKTDMIQHLLELIAAERRDLLNLLLTRPPHGLRHLLTANVELTTALAERQWDTAAALLRRK